MERTVEVEKEYRTNDTKRAIRKFFRSYPELSYWEEELKHMADNNIDFTCDDTLADGTKNQDWCYALHLDQEENYIYICIIERG